MSDPKRTANGSLDLNAALEQIISEGQSPTMGFANTQSQIQISKSGDPDVGRMAAIFQQAFPDMEFQPYEEDGRKGIRSVPKPRPTVFSPVPSGYSPQLANKGITDLQAALESAKTDEERYSIATKLHTLVQTERAYRFNDYKQRAEGEFGVFELTNAIESVRQAEMRSPFNPGNGLPSQQRMQLVEQLGVARTRASQRINEYMLTDPTLAAAEALAKGTITGIEGSLRLEGRQQIIDEKRIRDDARSAGISIIPPSFINVVSIIKRGAPVTDVNASLALAGEIYDKKIHLSDLENALATANPDQLMSAFVTSKPGAKERPMILNILKYHETDAVGGDAKQAERNVAIFAKLSDRDLSAEDGSVSPLIRDKMKKINSEVTAQTGLSSAEKSNEVRIRTLGLKREVLADTIRQSMYADLGQWNGLIRSDAVATEILKKSTSKDPINFRNFMDQYINFNDGKSIQDKNGALQAIVVSAMQSLPKSVVLPIPSEESFQLESQRMVAQRMLSMFHTRPVGQDAAFFERMWKESGSGTFQMNFRDLRGLQK